MTNPYEHDDTLSCDFGCNGQAEMTRVDGHTVPLCGPCYADKTDTCADCGRRYWIANLERIYGSSDLYCLDCASWHPHLIQARQDTARRDEQRDEFNERRR